jgi:hypothetical protein
MAALLLRPRGEEGDGGRDAPPPAEETLLRGSDVVVEATVKVVVVVSQFQSTAMRAESPRKMARPTRSRFAPRLGGFDTGFSDGLASSLDVVVGG